ncbi:MAG: hypothetical protein ACKVHE_30265 [Planctomycetales bacterium]
MHDWDLLCAALRNEVNRFTVGAIESLGGLQREVGRPHHLAWPAVRAYYGAFYAAHAILRLFGRALSQLEAVHANIVWKNADALQLTAGATSVDSGYYSATTSFAESTIHFRKRKNSHQDLWGAFAELMTSLKGEIPSATGLSDHKLKTLTFTGQLLDILKKDNRGLKGDWLSSVRNRINYRFEFGAWYPYAGRKERNMAVFETRAGRWMQSDYYTTSSGYRSEAEMFFTACCDIVTLCVHLVEAFIGRSQSVAPPLKRGVVKLMNLMQTNST